jgi:hypothetical protein
MDTHELSAALRAATEPIDAPPGFTEKVRHGARRRVLRRRYRVCATVLAVLAIAGGLTALSAHLKPEVAATHPDNKASATGKLPSDDPRLHEATKGGFAQNQSFHNQVVAVWQSSDHMPISLVQAYSGATNVDIGPAGPVNEYWAGNTPGGPVAVLLQAFSLRPASGGQSATVVEVGLVARNFSTGALTLVGHATVGDSDRPSESFAFDIDNKTMLTMAESGFHVYSAAPTVDPDTGKVTRQWLDLPYVDGVAVVDLAEEHGDGNTVVELPQRPDATHSYLPSNPNARSPFQPVSGNDWAGKPDPRLAWPVQTVVCAPPSGVDTTNLPQQSTVFDNALHAGGYSDPYVHHPPTVGTPGVPADSESHWYIGCRLANGNMLILGEELVGTIGRLYAVTADRDGRVVSVGYGGPINPSDLLPVQYQLPDGSGWLVAAYGSHLGSGAVSGNDVLAVPRDPNTTSVTVTSQHGVPHTVDLPP